MALPTSGQLSFSMIETEIGGSLNNVSLRNMSDFAGFSTPDSVSEFYGWSASVPSDISIVRYFNGSSNSVNISITSATNPQSFQSSYEIVQNFSLEYYNYCQDYYFYLNNTYYFYFNNTVVGTEIAIPLGNPPCAYAEYVYPDGNPTLNNNGLPVNLVSWQP